MIEFWKLECHIRLVVEGAWDVDLTSPQGEEVQTRLEDKRARTSLRAKKESRMKNQGCRSVTVMNPRLQYIGTLCIPCCLFRDGTLRKGYCVLHL